MDEPTIIVTGSSGFLGSAICVDLSRDNKVVGMDWRPPSAALVQAAPRVRWHTIDIADGSGVNTLFDRIRNRCGRVDFVLHMAAFYHFGQRWRPEDERVNVRGLRNILDAAARVGTRRFIFAGSIASLPPPPPGEALTETSTPIAATAYTRSKTVGESLLAQYGDRLPAIALRIGGVFSDWCELPPLYSLMRLWRRPGPMGRMIPGRGRTGFPFIHRQDLVDAVGAVIEGNDHLAPFDILFAAPSGCTMHDALFAGVHQACRPHLPLRPIHVSPVLARWFLMLKNGLKVILGRKRYERRWMMDYVDTPLVVDTAVTRRKLRWSPDPRRSIENCLPVLVQYLLADPVRWERRNTRRNEGRYEYESIKIDLIH
jgi:nucleoside-diphosphate-sugar epimerase